MTDLLTAQAEIKARKITRDTSGQFIRASKAAELKVARERMKAQLIRDVKAMDRARGVTYERAHFHALPHTPKPVEGNGELPVDLFARAA